MRRPRFSVVIPTRDRAHLLAGAIRSALAQTVDDLEVVVADNASVDGTVDVARAFDDPRVRFVRSTSARPMHESWRFALTQARGDLVGFLCDDDALHPSTLERAQHAVDALAADVVAWRACTHYAADWPDGRDRGRLRFGPPFSDRMLAISGPALIECVFDLRVSFTDLAPKMLNGVVARDVLRRLGEDGVQLFEPSCPDYSAMLGLATAARRMVLLDAPMLVTGAHTESVGASAVGRGDAARRYLDDLVEHERDLMVPVAAGPRITWLAQTYRRCAARMPALAGRVVNDVHLYGLAGLEIAAARRAGRQVEEYAGALEEALAGPLASRARAIREFVASERGIETERHLEVTGRDDRVLGIGPFRGPVIDAVAEGASTADEAARRLPRWIDRHAHRLETLWDDLAQGAGRREIVLYGLGLNGRALLRSLPPGAHPLRPRLLGYDDHAESDDGPVRRLDSPPDPARHFVLVTPDACAPICRRLEAWGFRATADFVFLADYARPASSHDRRSSSITAISRAS